MSSNGQVHNRLSIGFLPQSQSIATVRHAVQQEMADFEPRYLDSVLLVTSELMTNAISHAEAPFRLDLLGDSHGVLIAVTDESPTEHVRLGSPLAEPLAEHGRGLFLVDRLCANWGVTSGDTSKTVWAKLECD